MRKAELIFIPFPGWSHIVSMLEIVQFLVSRNDGVSVTMLLVKSPFDPRVRAFIDSLSSSSNTYRNINFVVLPEDNAIISETNPNIILGSMMENHKPHVRDAVRNLMIHHSKASGQDDPPRLSGIVLDTFCSSMMDVADEFGIPKYSSFPGGAGFLGLMLHLQHLRDNHNVDVCTEFHGTELSVPCFVNPLPASLFPDAVLDKTGADIILNHFKRIRETKGVIVNTFADLESHALRSLSDGKLPPVHAVGPILSGSGSGNGNGNGGVPGGLEEIIKWLDDQADSSVLFLCFGTVGGFSDAQVKEIGIALQNSGVHFLWSLRPTPFTSNKKKVENSDDSSYPRQVLSEEFFSKTQSVGKIIGWAPQFAILSHPAVGGFVSHCGWNSVLESISLGVPIAAWPMYAEQQTIAFQMVRDLGLAVEIRLDFSLERSVVDNDEMLINAQVIERAIKEVMKPHPHSGVRKEVKQMRENGKMAIQPGGSSYASLDRFIQDVFSNMP